MLRAEIMFLQDFTSAWAVSCFLFAQVCALINQQGAFDNSDTCWWCLRNRPRRSHQYPRTAPTASQTSWPQNPSTSTYAGKTATTITPFPKSLKIGQLTTAAPTHRPPCQSHDAHTRHHRCAARRGRRATRSLETKSLRLARRHERPCPAGRGAGVVARLSMLTVCPVYTRSRRAGHSRT